MVTSIRWKSVPGVAHTMASSTGQIKRQNKHGSWRIVKGSINTNSGRVQICCDDRKVKYRSRLVWSAFNGPIPKGMEIAHHDRNKLNDHPSNLRLKTHRQNLLNRVCKTNTGVPGVSRISKNTYKTCWMENGREQYKLFKTLNEAELFILRKKRDLYGADFPLELLRRLKVRENVFV